MTIKTLEDSDHVMDFILEASDIFKWVNVFLNYISQNVIKHLSRNLTKAEHTSVTDFQLILLSSEESLFDWFTPGD